MSETKKQHYVAQSYLKRLSINGNQKQIYTYVRKIGDIKINSITDVAQQKYFYDSEFDAHLPEGGKHALEGMFSKFETHFPAILDLVERGEPFGTVLSKDTFSYFVFLNLLRTKYWRKYLSRDAEKFGLSPSGMHFGALALPDLRDLFVSTISRKPTIRLKTQASHPFITSDNPVIPSIDTVKLRTLMDSGDLNLEILLEEISIMLPVSNNTLLWMPGKSDLIVANKSRIFSQEEILKNYIYHLCYFSTDQIFSSKKDGFLALVRDGMRMYDGHDTTQI